MARTQTGVSCFGAGALTRDSASTDFVHGYESGARVFQALNRIATVNKTEVYSDTTLERLIFDVEYTWVRQVSLCPWAIEPRFLPCSRSIQKLTLDQYGNVTQSIVYGYNNTTTPIQTYNNNYLNGSSYVSNYVLNRLVSSILTLPGNVNKTLVKNTYDQSTPTASGATNLLDTTASTARGLATTSATLASTTTRPT